MGRKNKRRKYPLVDRVHQYRFLGLIVGYNMVIVIFLVVAFFVPDYLQLKNETLSYEVRAAVADKILNMHSQIWLALIALVCLIGMHSFRVFHRFVGPLYRFKWAFEKIQGGDLSFRVHLRKDDYLRREEEALNRMIGALSEKIQNTQKAGRETLKSLGDLEESLEKGDSGDKDLHELLQAHRKRVDRLVDTGLFFKLEKEEIPSNESKPEV